MRSYDFDGERSRRCPLRPWLDHEEIADFFFAYNWLQRGMMPQSGTFLDQPMLYLSGIGIIEAAINEADEDQKKENSRRQLAAERAQKARPSKPGMNRPAPRALDPSPR